MALSFVAPSPAGPAVTVAHGASVPPVPGTKRPAQRIIAGHRPGRGGDAAVRRWHRRGESAQRKEETLP